MEWVMQTGNVPVAMPGKPGCLSGGSGGLLPPTLLDERRLPPFYLEAIALCGASTPSSLPHTALVYNLMVTSSLPRSMLSYIWSAVNRSLPGQLTRSEFFSALALIALAQRGESLAALSCMAALPVPTLTRPSPSTPSSTGLTMGGSPKTPSTPLTPTLTPSAPTSAFTSNHQNGFVPTALLVSGGDNGYKKDLVDLSMEDIEGEKRRRERVDVWTKMMEAGEQLIQQVMNHFEGRTNDVIREVCRTEKGSEVISMIGLVVGGMKRVSEADGREEMKRRTEKWNKKWEALNQYAIQKEEDTHGTERCDLCAGPYASISYSGRFYHGECANLWVNHVDPVLPIHIEH
ncbi:hypothetical protein PFISCL1PPCAC_10409 [Pristionchus fissidentatus]|uniref:EH domain-containing protein n=1 Tax=Pristionchus fissidentatus TaxID=1538716 RepID=A0AAV5VK98_9BILA|nr:hypothetical protein PFISCL1PPCAC_10409 [Pristionchus fissidentatus]